jgi:hypothetical protein
MRLYFAARRSGVASVEGELPQRPRKAANVCLAGSALAAPRAGFGDVERYPTLLEKATVLLERLARTRSRMET